MGVERDIIPKRYLGDAVYASVNENFMIVLTTIAEDGMSDSNRIYLEPEVMNALTRFNDDLWAHIRKVNREHMGSGFPPGCENIEGLHDVPEK